MMFQVKWNILILLIFVTTTSCGVDARFRDEKGEKKLIERNFFHREFERASCDCVNGGTCKEQNGYTEVCSCITGTSGEFCEIVDQCEKNATFCGNEEGAECFFNKHDEKADCRCKNDTLKFDKLNMKCRSTCNSSNKRCQNGGVCKSSGDSSFCKCMEGTSGDLCEVVHACQKSDFCAEVAECFFDVIAEEAACYCSDYIAYNPRKRTCEAFDECIYEEMFDKCNKPHEICSSGKCQCEENYRYTKDNKSCEEDKCALCPKDSTCEETESGIRCMCEHGYFDGVNCVRLDPCSHGISKCQQLCYKDICSCVGDFYIDKDGYSCKTNEDIPCSLDCSPGSCRKKGDKEECVCPPATHIIKDNRCIDKCTASGGKTPKGMTCPTQNCSSDEEYGFRCNCEDPYEQAEDGVHCKRKLMCKEQKAIDECEKKSALCKESDNDKGYECYCSDGFKMHEEVCTRICDLKEIKDQCAKKFAKCMMKENNQYECKCPPLLTEDSKGYCKKIAEYSYMGIVKFYKKRYEAKTAKGRQNQSKDDIDFLKLSKDLTESVKYVYDDNYQDLKILNCETNGNLLFCKIELQLKYNPVDVNVITSPKFCYPFTDEFCLLNLKFTVKRERVFKRTDPCDSDVKKNLCEKATGCTSTDERNFHCKCIEGFEAIGSYYPDTDAKTFIEICNDIDECRTPSSCPHNTTCLNTYGNYECICKDGYRKKEEKSNPKIDGCSAICDPNPCMNDGVCVNVDNQGYSCKCKPNFAGIWCNETVSVRDVEVDHKSAAIVGGVLGTLLFVVIIVAVVLYRK